MNQPVIRFMTSVNRWAGPVLLVVVVVAGAWTRDRWLPATHNSVRAIISGFRRGDSGVHAEFVSKPEDTHAGHEHPAHPGHNEEASLELSDSALRNIGLKDNAIRTIRFQTYRKTITVPAAVVEQPGRTRVQVATPMTGAVTHVHVVEGEAVQPGTLLFRIQLTHDDLVKAQTSLVHTLGKLDVEENEIARLKEIPNSGAVAGRFLLEHEYARESLTALLQAQRESLRLHGLSKPQVAQITKTRRLLGELQVFAPSPDDHSGDEIQLTEHLTQPSASTSQQGEPPAGEKSDVTAPLILQQLNVHKGQSVDVGETLCILTDLRKLYIKGMAFESDIGVLRQAWRRGWNVSAVFHPTDDRADRVDELEIAWLANEIDTDSRTLHFYVDLPNQIVDDRWQADCRFVDWKYFPGQRLKLQVPAEEWPDRIVLPVDAVATEGVEYFVFRKNGTHFERLPVHVEYRDQHSVVIASDGTLLLGDAVATRGVHQMQMALRNKAGGAPDPHTGHSH